MTRSMEDAKNIARAWSTTVWLSACDVPGSDEVGASTLCAACDGAAGPTHGDLARERSAAFLAEVKRRGIEDGETIPADVLAMDEAPDGFDGWPDALSIEHDEDCPIRFLLEQTADLAAERERVERLRVACDKATNMMAEAVVDSDTHDVFVEVPRDEWHAMVDAFDALQPGDLGEESDS